MMMVRATRESEAGIPPSPELLSALIELTVEGMEDGVVLETGGLLPSRMGSRLRLGGGRVTVTDGPFVELKELIGGYAIVQAKSKQQAIDLGRRFLEVHARVLGPSYEGELEIRPLFDGTDTCPNLASELREPSPVAC